ncbi:MAG: hypothetical protein JHC33_12165 [Ignisphaera sp.]|nr:hypothetical protein [Ignisphaera sp.]
MPITTTLTPYVGSTPQYGVQDQLTFVARAEYSWTWISSNIIADMNNIITQANTLETNVNDKEASATSSALSASNSATIALNSANFKGTWLVGTDYLLGDSVSLNNQIYRALQNNTGQTPIPVGTTYWVLGTVDIHGQSAKGSLVDNDELLITDSASSYSLKKVLVSTLKTIFQPFLVSGTNIKTINSSSIIGSGNLTVTDSSKLPLSGGTMTGAITAIRETKIAMGASDIDLSTGNVFTKTITANTTLTRSNVLASGNVNSIILELTFGATLYTITWFTGVKWAGGIVPTFLINTTNIIGIYSHDGGTTWRGSIISKDSK